MGGTPTELKQPSAVRTTAPTLALPRCALLYADISFEAKYGVYPLLPLREKVPEGGMRGRFRPLPGFQNGNCGRSNLRTCFSRGADPSSGLRPPSPARGEGDYPASSRTKQRCLHTVAAAQGRGQLCDVIFAGVPPPPLAGEGRGGGHAHSAQTTKRSRTRPPPPLPSPAAQGRGRRALQFHNFPCAHALVRGKGDA